MDSLGKATFTKSKAEPYSFQSIYYGTLEAIVPKLPKSFQSLLATVVILLAGISMNGDWINIFTHVLRYIKQSGNSKLDIIAEHFSDKFKGLPYCLLSSVCINCGFYLLLCCYLQWYFYIRQRDTPESWKCQPKKFLSWKDEKHEILLGTACSVQASVISGILSCYVTNGGHTTLYYNISDHGLVYFCLSIPLFFIYLDASLYYAHRMLHFPLIYKIIHKYHHRYKQPTPFSTLAMHPLELLLDQTIALIPNFFVPIHGVVFFAILGYNYYYSILSHSGIKMDSIWPWQCSTLFHDDHHQFFHVNFGINTAMMDKLHGTYREKNRIYNETIFYGRGKSLNEATVEELAEHEKNN